MNQSMVRIKYSPYVALLWSAMMPGFGHLYNKDYWLASAFFIIELGLNFFANINNAITQAFNPFYYKGADLHLNMSWALFYPGMYAFSMWHAYNRAIEKNALLKEIQEPVTPKLTGCFIGLTIGMQFGLIWPLYHTLLLTSLGYGLAGATIGTLLEKTILSKVPLP
ncbi:hypothetical protein [Desulforamulus aeronauticus]|uniref:DUF5683 domain-containing protein n=1 Tax=Desulforamulus aeronauticus DSM 10349 TaxID=1121421 RepID=A0A1M6TZ71_9FIRM|nr:hypothetical protein [Desulforamulus aeronauticus]SHK62246.1 hypothetical protein SAMN02745123_02522 [Desulforamulus aeronauticus DSM 10349]